jgi:hypothetical protein
VNVLPTFTVSVSLGAPHVEVGPLSTTPSQLSSIALHVSVVGVRVTVSLGHVAVEPVQYSMGSQYGWFTDARHTVLDGWNRLPGHATLLPSQTSCGSQIPAVARHTVPADVRVSLGHADPLPAQYSAGSQMPALARQIVPAPGTRYVITTRPWPVFTPAVLVCAVPTLYEPPPPPHVE